jgi:hypothetical protein
VIAHQLDNIFNLSITTHNQTYPNPTERLFEAK